MTANPKFEPNPDAENRPETPRRPATEAAPGSDIPRRNFLSKTVAMVTGAAIVLVPLGAGIVFFLNPVLRRFRIGSGDLTAALGEDFVRVAPLASLPSDGHPQVFVVYKDLVDAWNKFVNQPIGRVYLRKLPDGKVTAFNVRCPHLGCAVDYRPSQNDYFCPCHRSAFNLDGKKENEIPPRGMDSLEVRVEGSEVWVRYQSFKAATPEKIAIPG